MLRVYASERHKILEIWALYSTQGCPGATSAAVWDLNFTLSDATWWLPWLNREHARFHSEVRLLPEGVRTSYHPTTTHWKNLPSTAQHQSPPPDHIPVTERFSQSHNSQIRLSLPYVSAGRCLLWRHTSMIQYHSQWNIAIADLKLHLDNFSNFQTRLNTVLQFKLRTKNYLLNIVQTLVST